MRDRTATATAPREPQTSPAFCVVCELRSQISETPAASRKPRSLRSTALLGPRAFWRDTRSRQHAPGWRVTPSVTRGFTSSVTSGSQPRATWGS